MRIFVATRDGLLVADPAGGALDEAPALAGRSPTCLAADPLTRGRVWCGTEAEGLWRSDDDGASWRPVGLEGEELTAVAASPVEPGLVWTGTEPSALWRSADGGAGWQRADGLDELPSAPEWSFPPRPDTHHVRWIACHPRQAGRLGLAIEAGALVATPDGGRTWHDRVAGGPYDTHQLAIH
ncbi:MAG TPA: glycosyl hydrolase, partial [Thermoanaerobaculia bacterium]|nr:glycosyl hydrolase [Thermoanaerobaculia bacterium]